MIFQQFNLVPRMDVVSNVLHGTLNARSMLATMFNLYPRSDIHRAIEILDRLGIAEQAAQRAEDLSGGQQQRVAIARALMQDPRIILADEPIASLDPMNAQVVMQALRRIHEEDGRMIIADLHTLDTARRYCDRVIGMRDGRIVFDGTPAQLTTGAARDIYGAGADFSEAATSTDLETLDGPELRKAEALGVGTGLFAPADYDGVIQGLLGGTIDMAWLGASAYAATCLQDPDAVAPVLVKVNVDGSIGYHFGFARADSGITSLEDMEGKSFGLRRPELDLRATSSPPSRSSNSPARAWSRGTISAR